MYHYRLSQSHTLTSSLRRGRPVIVMALERSNRGPTQHLTGSRPVANEPFRALLNGSLHSPIVEPTLDMNIFHGLRSFLEPAQLAEMYREFLRLTRNRLEVLRADPPPETVRNITHTIAGTAGMLGAQALATQARQIEDDADRSFSFAMDVDLLREACDTLSHALCACKVNL